MANDWDYKGDDVKKDRMLQAKTRNLWNMAMSHHLIVRERTNKKKRLSQKKYGLLSIGYCIAIIIFQI